MKLIFRDYENTKVLVTGGSGFIGRWVCRFLTRVGAQIHAVVRSGEAFSKLAAEYEIRANVVEMDLTDFSGVKTMIAGIAPRVLFNLAGYGVDPEENDEQTSYAINDELVGHLAMAMARVSQGQRQGPAMVHVGSAAEYGTNEKIIRENTVPKPAFSYGKSKLAGFHRLSAVCRSQGVAAVTLRPFTVYGPGEHPHRLLPSLISAAGTGADLDLTAGLQKRDFIYVGDVAEGILRAGLLPQGGDHEWFNIATGTLLPVREFVHTAARELNLKESQLRFGKKKTGPNDLVQGPVDISRIERTMGWKPETDIAEGIRKTVDFLNSRR